MHLMDLKVNKFKCLEQCLNGSDCKLNAVVSIRRKSVKIAAKISIISENS